MSHYENHDESLQENLDLSLLRINNSFNAGELHPPCTSCGCSGFSTVSSFSNSGDPVPNPSTAVKRPSPESSPATQPNPKKLFSQLQDADLSLLGISKVSLPFASFSNPTHALHPSTPLLRRSSSDPSPGPESGNPTPENARIGASHQETTASVFFAQKGTEPSALPPLPPSLKRSVSVPNPSPAKTYSMGGDFVKEESPNTKRLRRMKERMKQMSKWCNKVLQDSEDVCPEHNPEENCGESEEAVSVEKVGESMILHFKCPCGKGYQILLSGRDCYYKLM